MWEQTINITKWTLGLKQQSLVPGRTNEIRGLEELRPIQAQIKSRTLAMGRFYG